MARGLAVLLLVAACAAGTPVKDGGSSCPSDSVQPLPAAELSVRLIVCPKNGPIFFAPNYLQVLRSDGGTVLFANELCSSCDRCPSIVICDPLASIKEIEVGASLVVLDEIDGRDFADAGTCPTTGDTCSVRTELPAGTYRARQCTSRSATRDAQGRPVSLGPLDCIDRPFEIPFTVGGVAATFE
jgi:hypothetical protein